MTVVVDGQAAAADLIKLKEVVSCRSDPREVSWPIRHTDGLVLRHVPTSSSIPCETQSLTFKVIRKDHFWTSQSSDWILLECSASSGHRVRVSDCEADASPSTPLDSVYWVLTPFGSHKPSGENSAAALLSVSIRNSGHKIGFVGCVFIFTLRIVSH